MKKQISRILCLLAGVISFNLCAALISSSALAHTPNNERVVELTGEACEIVHYWDEEAETYRHGISNLEGLHLCDSEEIQRRDEASLTTASPMSVFMQVDAIIRNLRGNDEAHLIFVFSQEEYDFLVAVSRQENGNYVGDDFCQIGTADCGPVGSLAQVSQNNGARWRLNDAVLERAGFMVVPPSSQSDDSNNDYLLYGAAAVGVGAAAWFGHDYVTNSGSFGENGLEYHNIRIGNDNYHFTINATEWDVSYSTGIRYDVEDFNFSVDSTLDAWDAHFGYNLRDWSARAYADNEGRSGMFLGLDAEIK